MLRNREEEVLKDPQLVTNLISYRDAFNNQTDSSFNVWEKFINNDRAVGFHSSYNLLHGIMRSFAPYLAPVGVTGAGIGALQQSTNKDVKKFDIGGIIEKFQNGNKLKTRQELEKAFKEAREKEENQLKTFSTPFKINIPDLVQPTVRNESESTKKISFSEAFRENRSKLGDNAIFEWNGKKYSTNLKEDNKIITPSANVGINNKSTPIPATLSNSVSPSNTSSTIPYFEKEPIVNPRTPIDKRTVAPPASTYKITTSTKNLEVEDPINTEQSPVNKVGGKNIFLYSVKPEFEEVEYIPATKNITVSTKVNTPTQLSKVQNTTTPTTTPTPTPTPTPTSVNDYYSKDYFKDFTHKVNIYQSTAIRDTSDASFKSGRPLVNKGNLIVAHHTGHIPGQSFDSIHNQFMTNKEGNAHALINKDGSINIYASPEQITSHAGESRWGISNPDKVSIPYSLPPEREGINDFSFGIEFFNEDTKINPLTEAQVRSGSELISKLLSERSLSLDDFVTHGMIAPHRKHDIVPKEYGRILEELRKRGHVFKDSDFERQVMQSIKTGNVQGLGKWKYENDLKKLTTSKQNSSSYNFREFHNVGTYQNGGILSKSTNIVHTDREDTLGMTGMMKSVMALASEFKNPTARRMTNMDSKNYTFNGTEYDGALKEGKGNVFVSTWDNLITPQIQEVNGVLKFIKEPWSKENARRSYKQSLKFNSNSDANYFAENYKKIAPMMNFYK